MKLKFILFLAITFFLIIISVVVGCSLLNKRKVEDLQYNKRYQDCLEVRKQDCIDINMACREERKPEKECKDKNNKCITKAEKVCLERNKDDKEEI